MKSEHQLFIELTSEEASSVTGGNTRAVFAEVAQIIATGGSNQSFGVIQKIRGVVLRKYGSWSSKGGGVILGDVKGGRIGDIRRLTYNSRLANMPDDLPNGWDWGIIKNGKVRAGGFGGPMR